MVSIISDATQNTSDTKQASSAVIFLHPWQAAGTVYFGLLPCHHRVPAQSLWLLIRWEWRHFPYWETLEETALRPLLIKGEDASFDMTSSDST